MRRNLLSLMTLLAAPVALVSACATDEVDELGASLEAENADGAAGLDGFDGMDALSTHRGTEAIPGFAVDIAVDGDDVTFDWTASGVLTDQGPVEDIMLILRGEDPSALIEFEADDLEPFCGGLGTPSFDILEPGDATTYVDTGAASQTSATPTYFYRVVRVFEDPDANLCHIGVGEQSTLLAKVTTETAPGYVNVGLCMLDGPEVASQIAAQVGDSVVSVHAWNEQTQSWLWWWTSAGAGPFGDFALPFGGMVTLNLDDTAPAYVSMVGTVPTDEASLAPVEGINHLTTPLLTASMLADTASGFVDGLGWYEGVGVWDVHAQAANWYHGPGDGDFGLEACRPYKFQGTPDACSSDAECNDGQYCAFDVTTACGETGPGACTPIPLGCGADDQPVCGCDEVTYANSCEAQLAGASVASVGACEVPPSACPCAGGPLWDSFLATAQGAMLDSSECIDTPDFFLGMAYDPSEGIEMIAGVLLDETPSCVANDYTNEVFDEVLLTSPEQVAACVAQMQGWVDSLGMVCD
ncbi:MAG: hypothetical protein AAGF11_12520 [Myxococcota bacterium]